MVPWLLLLSACWLREDYPEPNCNPRSAFYPDEDGDGVGEPSAIFVGCEAPPGWVATLEGADSADTGVTSDSGG